MNAVWLVVLCDVALFRLALPGAVGIDMAKDDNPCSSVNSTVTCMGIFTLENATTGGKCLYI